MKKSSSIIFFAAIILSMATAVGLAKDMYVSENSKLNLRTGKGVKFPVVTVLEEGEAVTAVSESAGWAKIITQNGDEGWAVSKYLTNKKPADIKIENLSIQVETLQGQLETATLENHKLKEENINLTTRLNEKNIKLDNIEKEFSDLQSAAKEYLDLKKKYDRIAGEIDEKNSQIELLEKKVDDHYINRVIKWALTGAGILLFGFILGARTKQKRSILS